MNELIQLEALDEVCGLGICNLDFLGCVFLLLVCG